jgi:hypothetical protein
MADYSQEFLDLVEFDNLLTFDTQQQADDFILPLIKAATPSELKMMRLAFMGDLLEGDNKMAHDGPGVADPRPYDPPARGAAFGGGSAEPHEKAYNLMELSDSIHDALTRREKARGHVPDVPIQDRRKYIHHCVGPKTLPVVSVRTPVTYDDWDSIAPGQYEYTVTRRQMTLDDVQVWERFLDIMTTNPTLEFRDEKTPVVNPLCGKNFTDGMFEWNPTAGKFYNEYGRYLAKCMRVSKDDIVPDPEVYNVIDRDTFTTYAGGSVYTKMLTEYCKARAFAHGIILSSPDLVKSMEEFISTKSDKYVPLNRGSIMNVEVWNETVLKNPADHVMRNDKKTRFQIMRLTQLADLCRCMRRAFGREARFMPDTTDTIVQMLVGLKFSYAAFKVGLRVDEKDAAEFLPPGTWERDDINADVVRDILAKVRTELDVHWSSWYCDGAVMDSKQPLSGLKLHNKATNEMFHTKSAVQVSLRHVTPTEYRYVLSSPVPAIRVGDPKIRKVVYGATGETDDNGRPVFAWTEDGEFVSHSATVAAECVEIGARAWVQAGRPGVYAGRGVSSNLADTHREAAIPLAMKRAGDWGMIRHCKQHGMVFCTVDKFAALYAVFMDVRVMFLRVRRPADDLVQYSFALHIVDDAKNAAQAGGGRDMVMWATMLAVIVAASLFQ